MHKKSHRAQLHNAKGPLRSRRRPLASLDPEGRDLGPQRQVHGDNVGVGEGVQLQHLEVAASGLEADDEGVGIPVMKIGII